MHLPVLMEIMKKIVSISLIFAFALLLCSCGNEYQKFNKTSFESFDTVTTITGFEKTEEKFKENCKKIEEKLYNYHRLYTIYSRYDGVNNLTLINERVDGKHTVKKVSSEMVDMLLFSKKMYDLTGGKINVAMGSVLSIWHDYREQGLNNPEKASLPSMATLKKAAEHTDINKLEINNNTVFLSDPKMSLDVGAIAKGYAVEQTALWMKKNGMNGYLLNVGGNIRVVGKRPDGKKWQVGIENPDRLSNQAYVEYLELEDMSLAVSGSYQRFYTVDGNEYHHIIDPETLMPAKGFKSVSVLCEDSGLADSLSTALFTMSLEDGQKLIASLENTHAMWVTEAGKLYYSENFKNFTKEDTK